jgi:hypothetical protein
MMYSQTTSLQVAVVVSIGQKVVHAGIRRSKKQRVDAVMTPDQARDLACNLLQAADYADTGAEWQGPPVTDWQRMEKCLDPKRYPRARR